MSVLHGFEQTRQRRIDELDAALHEYIHTASGARLCWLEREDENKSFCAAFRTLPFDDTGVFHILEHSVLCGSKHFPVKEPFVELMKGSLNTFLNALTFPDKTCYPVASRNSRDFLNLMRVYLDAVFFPSIHEKPEIFQQEGWYLPCLLPFSPVMRLRSCGFAERMPCIRSLSQPCSFRFRSS